MIKNMQVVLRIGIMLVPAQIAVACGGPGVTGGTVVMKVTETQAHVRMGSREVEPGDGIQVVRNQCTGGRGGSHCHRVVVGRGQVTQVLGDRYSVVEFPTGVAFKEGDTVEKTR